MVAKRQADEVNRQRPLSKVWIDQYSGKVLAVQDPNKFTPGETFLNLLWPLHDGQALGLPVRRWFYMLAAFCDGCKNVRHTS